jgi:hypothetical protein
MILSPALRRLFFVAGAGEQGSIFIGSSTNQNALLPRHG